MTGPISARMPASRPEAWQAQGGFVDDIDHAAATIGIYRRHAAAFDRKRVRVLFEQAWLDRFLALMPDGAAVLDLGCGMAEPIAAYLIGAGCRVTGVDSSPAMLALCRARFPGQRWIEADMRRLALGERFDGILAWDSFFFLPPDAQRAMMPVFAAHAAPGAALLFTSGPKAGEAHGSFEGEALYHASLDPAEYRSLLGAQGFAAIAHVAEDPDCDRHSVWLARMENRQP